jgi:hypothetical protein
MNPSIKKFENRGCIKVFCVYYHTIGHKIKTSPIEMLILILFDFSFFQR